MAANASRAGTREPISRAPPEAPPSGDLFGNPPPEQRTTCFGEGLDELARAKAAWPADAMVYAVAVVNERTCVSLTGGIPSGWDRKGFPTFPKRATEYCAVVTLAEYREAFAKAELAEAGQ